MSLAERLSRLLAPTHRVLLLLWPLSSCGAPYQPSGPVPKTNQATLNPDTLSPGTPVRVTATGRQLEGRLRQITPDSLRLARPNGDTTMARASLDSLYVRGRPSYRGTRDGALAGLVLGSLVLLAGSRSQQPEDRGYSLIVAAMAGGMSLGLGILADLGSTGPWVGYPLH